MIAKTPEPPYYAVIFTSIRSHNNEGYSETANRMMEQASKQDGFLGIETAHDDVGITISYWKDMESIKNWKKNPEHKLAQEKGIKEWYKYFSTRITKVERDNFFEE